MPTGKQQGPNLIDTGRKDAPHWQGFCGCDVDERMSAADMTSLHCRQIVRASPPSFSEARPKTKDSLPGALRRRPICLLR